MPSHEALLSWVASSSSMPAPGLLSIIRQSAGVPNGANVESAVVGSKPQTVDILEVEIDRADSKTTKCAADALNSTFWRTDCKSDWRPVHPASRTAGLWTTAGALQTKREIL